jgi:hypothetical protein
MLSDEFWEPFEFVLEPGTLVYPIGEHESILPTDMVRSEKYSNKWIQIKDRYTACAGSSIAGLEREYGSTVLSEVFREYLS